MTRIEIEESRVYEHFFRLRWPQGVKCPECDCSSIYTRRSKKRNHSHVFRCSECRASFSLKSGTFFQNARLPLSRWIELINLMLSRPEGLSSTELARKLNIRQASAWWCLRRLRAVARRNHSNFFDRPLMPQKLDSTGVSRSSPFPSGLTVDEVLRRLLETKRLPKNSIGLSRHRMTESGRPVRRSSRDTKHREVFYAYPT